MFGRWFSFQIRWFLDFHVNFVRHGWARGWTQTQMGCAIVRSLLFKELGRIFFIYDCVSRHLLDLPCLPNRKNTGIRIFAVGPYSRLVCLWSLFFQTGAANLGRVSLDTVIQRILVPYIWLLESGWSDMSCMQCILNIHAPSWIADNKATL